MSSWTNAASVTRRVTAIVCLLSLCALACNGATDKQIVLLHEEEGYQSAWQRYRDSAAAGPNGSLIVEGDLFFESEEKLKAYYDERMLEERDKAHAFKQVSTGYIPAFEFPDNVDIKYCVSDSFGAQKATWVSRLAEAAQAWERQVNVRFVYRSEFDASCSDATSGVDFAMVKTDLAGGYCASSKLNWLTCSTGTGVLEIDTLQDMTFGGAAPNVTPTGAIRHELGHILGLRHEHPWRSMIDPSCDEPITDNFWDYTGEQLGNVAYDQNSVMHYPFDGTSGGGDCGGNKLSDFSIKNSDSHSVQRLYGMHPAWFIAMN